MEKRILLFSGGLDSYIAYRYLSQPPTIYFNTDVAYSKKEIETIRSLIPSTIIDSALSLASRQIPTSDTAFIPMRNLYFAMLACKYGDEIIIAGLKDDMVNDKNKEVFKRFSTILSELNEREIKVNSPFWDMTKADIVRWYLDSGGTAEELLNTISCYAPQDSNYCGKCKCCFRKWVALRVNGVKLDFHNPILVREYYEKAKRKYYVQQRNENIIRVAEEYLNNRKIYYVDIDGILTNEIDGHNYCDRTPNLENIRKINKLRSEGSKVILWSSRFQEDREITERWLLDNCVQYDELLLGKPQYDFIIDDKVKLL